MPSLKIVTVLLGSAVPLNVGALLLVMLSVLETPVSLAVFITGFEGALGAVASMLMVKAPEAAETLPAVSVAVAVMLCVPWVGRLTVMPGLLKEAAVPLATWVPSLKILTVLVASAVPVNVGVVSLVTLSVFDTPLSLAAVRSGVE